MENELISIIVPIYNCEKYLEESINSIINQTYHNLEIILVNDGSTDKSLNICKKFADRDERIKILSQENKGATFARNSGLKKSKGKYLMFFDADDILCKDAVLKMANNFKKEECDIVIGSCKNIDENGEIFSTKTHYNDDIFSNKKVYEVCSNYDPFPGNKLYKSEIIRENLLEFDHVKIAQDLNFYLKYLIFCKNVITISECVSYYRIVNNSISRTYSFNILDIVNSFKKIKEFYNKYGMEKMYIKYLSIVEMKHYLGQMNKLTYFESKSDRKKILTEFSNAIKKIKFTINIKNIIIYIKYKLKIIFKDIYISNFYSNYYKRKQRLKI